jgi:hypothetical protein
LLKLDILTEEEARRIKPDPMLNASTQEFELRLGLHSLSPLIILCFFFLSPFSSLFSSFLLLCFFFSSHLEYA